MVTNTIITQLLPLAGCLLILLIPRNRQVLAVIATVLFALAEMVIAAISIKNGAQFNASTGFGVTLSFNFDKLAALTIMVISFATAAAALYSLRHNGLANSFYSMIMLILFGTTGVALAADLIQFYVFWEAMLIPAWILVINNNEEPEKVKYVSLKFFIITHIGAVLMLVSILWINSLTGLSNMASLAAALTSLPLQLVTILAVLFIMGFIVKLAIFPFHSWLPDAYTSSIMPVTLILVGVLTNIGIYGLARFISFFGTAALAPVSVILMGAAVITMFYGGIMALVEKNIKRILAYSSMSQMGYVLFALATLIPLGIGGAMFNLVNQAITKILLFIAVGTVAAYAGTYDISFLGGWGKRLPFIAIIATTGVLSLVGAPPAMGFWPELLTFSAGFNAGHLWLSILALVASVISVAYGFRLIRLTFHGEYKGNDVVKLTPVASTLTVAGICFALLLVLGIFPGILFSIILESLTQIGFTIGG